MEPALRRGGMQSFLFGDDPVLDLVIDARLQDVFLHQIVLALVWITVGSPRRGGIIVRSINFSWSCVRRGGACNLASGLIH
jgi:hypothetical protein